METLNPISVTAANQTAHKKTNLSGLFSRQAEAFEKARFGWMAILLTLQSCLGSIACMMILMNDASTLLLSTCAAITMGSNAVFISQMSGRWSLGTFYLSIIVNLAIIFSNLP